MRRAWHAWGWNPLSRTKGQLQTRELGGGLARAPRAGSDGKGFVGADWERSQGAKWARGADGRWSEK